MEPARPRRKTPGAVHTGMTIDEANEPPTGPIAPDAPTLRQHNPPDSTQPAFTRAGRTDAHGDP